MNNREPQEADPYSIYCLCIDMIGSTEAGLELPTRLFDRFNQELVEQIKPHLEKLELTDALLKFTGDGWLLMTHEEKKVPALCCLATIMANRFQDEMAQRTSIPRERIPGLHLAICSGRDVRVQLPDGRTDWVGDSARRAVRASGHCLPNEILVDEPVRYCVLRDFDIERLDVQERAVRHHPKKMEEEFPLSRLGELRSEAASASDAPGCFVYTLEVLGKAGEAQALAEEAAGRLVDKASKARPAQVEVIQQIRHSWNRLLHNLSDYSFAVELLEHMRQGTIPPDVFTYTIIIHKAPDYDTAKSWLETMRAEGIQPDVVTYNSLIAMAPDYDTAKSWLETMQAEGIQPNVVNYNTLIAMAPDYETAKNWLQTMRAEGIQPDVVTYSSLFSKDVSGTSAEEVLRWYSAQEYHPEEAIQAIIAGYRKTGRIEEALRLALDYAHLPAALKVIREHRDEALEYFQNIFDGDPEHPNAAYALSLTFFELDQLEQARLYLKKALRLATAPARQAIIQKRLEEIDRTTADK